MNDLGKEKKKKEIYIPNPIIKDTININNKLKKNSNYLIGQFKGKFGKRIQISLCGQ